MIGIHGKNVAKIGQAPPAMKKQRWKMNGNPIETSSGLLQSNGFSLLRSQYCTRIKLLRKWSIVIDTKRKFGAHLLVVASGGVGNSGNIATTEGRSPKGGTIR
ncbi:hypothetical protein B0H13DRAFT_1857594 [Mycena leptocephala]|nr:hypothetical protein B0H13DRAFT_1857594 [Mycena leptocephala]